MTVVRSAHRTKEMIDGRALPPLLLELRQPQMSVDRAEIRIRGDHIHGVPFERRGFRRLLNRHVDMGLQEVG
jgi:hypothetical protein